MKRLACPRIPPEQDHRGVKGRYRSMRGFKNLDAAQRFCRAFDEIRNFLRPTLHQPDHLVTEPSCRVEDDADRAARPCHRSSRRQRGGALIDPEAHDLIAVLVRDEQDILSWTEGKEAGRPAA